MDNTTLRQLSSRELAFCLREAIVKQSVPAVSRQLLASIEQESLPPTVYSLWLTATADHSVPLQDALFQQFSKHVRKAAIQRLGKDLRSAQWQVVWSDLGGTEGLLALFAHSSVNEVKMLSRAIGRCRGRSRDGSAKRQAAVTSLFQALFPNLYPTSKLQSSDPRPLEKHYAQIIPACTSECVLSILTHEPSVLSECIPKKRVAQYHCSLLRHLVIEVILGHALNNEGMLLSQVKEASIMRDYLPSLLQHLPQLPGLEPKLSASMDFSIAVLEKITTQKDPSLPEIVTNRDGILPEDFVLSELMEPLMRRMIVRKITSDTLRPLLDLVIAYLKARPKAATQCSLNSDGIIFQVARLWSTSAPHIHDQLAALIGLPGARADQGIGAYQPTLDAVRQSRRFELLQTILLHSKGIGEDIESDEGLGILGLGPWPTSIFLSLPLQDALQLLRRMIRLHPEAGFLTLGSTNTIMSQPTGPGGTRGDAALLLRLLSRETEPDVEQAEAVIKEKKATAVKSRAQTDRAFFAKSALFYAIASGSLRLYKELTLWLRRFLHDPLTVKSMFHAATTMVEGIRLLSGIPELLDRLTANDICKNVVLANSILLELLGTAAQSLKEPSFSARDWYGLFRLFGDVVMVRLNSAGKLKRIYNLTEDELYDVLWTDTLKMLLEAEKIGLSLEHENLGFNFPSGPISRSQESAQTLRPALPSSFRFLDDLARARNTVWRKHRLTVHPAAAVLEAPWPRGLPIQHLTQPFDIAVEAAFDKMPFIASRAADIVMLDSQSGMASPPNQEDIKLAIGQFVESYDIALAIHVLQRPSRERREEAARNVYFHATGNLSRQMSQSEAALWWQHIYKRVLPDVKFPLPIRRPGEEYPMVPSVTNPFDITEWHPALAQPAEISPRDLETTCLDCMLYSYDHTEWDLNRMVTIPRSQTLGMIPASIWSSERLRHVRPMTLPMKEGFIASALLYQDSRIEGASRILATPFPSGADIRYPAMFLDEDFLLSKEVSESSARDVLLHFEDMVPPSLLLSLISAAFEVLSSTSQEVTKAISREDTAYRLLILLLKSDRPQCVFESLLHAILDHPEASSWHRQFLTKGFMRDLSSAQAESMMQSFASSVCKKLAEQASLPRPQPQADDISALPKPAIKVTTVKFLAQFVADADFISPHLAADVLSDIFRNATHIDIRAAVVNSMLCRLRACADDSSASLAERLMQCLEGTVAVLGSLNERHPMQMHGWKIDRTTGLLPEIYASGGIEALPPLLDLICQAIIHEWMPSSHLHQRLIYRVLLPAIRMSGENNTQWTTLFLSRHAPSSAYPQIPRLPAKPRILSSLLRWRYQDMPRFVLDLFHQWFMFTMSPPEPHVAKLNEGIRKDVNLHNSNEGQHWLSLYGREIRNFGSLWFNTAYMLTKVWTYSTIEDGIELPYVQTLVHEEAKLLCGLDDIDFGEWERLVDTLKPPLTSYSSEQDRKAWKANAKPVLERILDTVDAMRTPAWQRDPQRKPLVLPMTFAYRLWLLDYPILSPSLPRVARCETFAAQLANALKDVMNLGVGHHDQLKAIEAASLECAHEDRVLVACHLGQLRGDPSGNMLTQEAILRVEIADALFRGANLAKDTTSTSLDGSKEECSSSVADVLNSWRVHHDEGIRMRGMRLMKLLEL